MHAESLLHIPLVAQMLGDPETRFMARAIDCEWFYQKVINRDTVGFGPHQGFIYCGENSKLKEFLKAPERSARQWNHEDRLAREVLFAVHDYLHGWAYRAIAALAPDFGFGTGEITEKNFEDHVFCHLLTETAATVGLDYWYLATINFNDVVPIGSTVVNLTTPYHEKFAPECHKFLPNLRVQDVGFFSRTLELYTRDLFTGIDIDETKQSPFLFDWIYKEIAYSETARENTREWLAHLADIELKVGDVSAPCLANKKWQMNLANELARLLWEKVKENKMHSFPGLSQYGTPWRSSVGGARLRLDFRFLNLNFYSGAEVEELFGQQQDHGENRIQLFRQYLSRFRFADVEPAAIEILRRHGESLNFRELSHLLPEKAKIHAASAEARDLFLLG